MYNNLQNTYDLAARISIRRNCIFLTKYVFNWKSTMKYNYTPFKKTKQTKTNKQNKTNSKRDNKCDASNEFDSNCL